MQRGPEVENTVKTHGGDIVTMQITLLYQVCCYIWVKNKEI